MGFFSYNLQYYAQRLAAYEAYAPGAAPAQAVHEARVLYKLLDDLADEGYHSLRNRLCAEENAVERLAAFLGKNGSAPFPMEGSLAVPAVYGETETPLSDCLDRLAALVFKGAEGAGAGDAAIPPFFPELMAYALDFYAHGGGETARAFLLRDTLLPYLAARYWDASCGASGAPAGQAYALPVGRRLLSLFPEGAEDADALFDALHGILFDALAQYPADGAAFFRETEEQTRAALAAYPVLTALLSEWLLRIPGREILLAESGYCGSMILLLKALDPRVTFRMYTTIPQFSRVFAGRIYTDAFENNRRFETIRCQDALFTVSSVRGGTVFVKETADAALRAAAEAELLAWGRMLGAAERP